MKSDKETWAAIIDPQPGDLFTEMYSFWLHVLDRNKYTVKVLIAHGGDTVPPDGKVAEVPLDIYKQFMEYGEHLPEKSWCTLVKRDQDFTEFLKSWDNFKKFDGFEKYINPIRKDHPFVTKTVNQLLKDPKFKDVVTEMVVQSLLKMKLREE